MNFILFPTVPTPSYGARSKAEDVFVSLRIVAVGFLFRAGPLCAWQLILRLSEFEKSLTGTCTQGVLHRWNTVMFYINLLKHYMKRLDRIIIQLFAMLGHYLEVFLLLFLVEKDHSLS